MSAEVKRFYRSRKERMLAGVCGGLGNFFSIDPTIIRLIFILAVFIWLGPFVPLIYLVLWIVVPEEPVTTLAPLPVEPTPIEAAPAESAPEEPPAVEPPAGREVA